MSDENLPKVEAFLMELLQASDTPLTPEELVSAGRARGPFYTEDAIREAVLSLMSSGRAVLARGWSLQQAWVISKRSGRIETPAHRYSRLNPTAVPVRPDASERDIRTPGQTDRDRILYTSAFRRLAGVTQVVGPLEGHIFHNRLTHTIEVAQIARRLAERLRELDPNGVARFGGVDPDVVEAAAFAHDLGHPPFGHIAEHTLDQLAIDNGAPDGFEGNAQSFRIVTRLAAHRTGYKGLNLTRATLNAVLKYPWFRGEGPLEKSDKFGAYRSEKDDLRVSASRLRLQLWTTLMPLLIASMI
jgi:dGTP triphosphohydrolase